MNMKLSLITSLFLCGFTSAQQSEAVNPASDQWQVPQKRNDFHVFLLMGQSNMNGAAKTQVGDEKPVPHVLGLVKQPEQAPKWIPAAHPLQNFPQKKSFSLGIPFAKQYLTDHKGITVGLIPAARGGHSIARLRKGTEGYSFAIEQAKFAMKQGTLKAILWHQGESDTVSDRSANDYDEKLQKLITNLRNDLGHQKLPFIVGNLAEFYGTGPGHNKPERIKNINKVRATLRALPANVANTGFVESTDCKSMDRHMVHFDRDSYILLGKRYAEAFKKMETEKKP
jgi:hypothetical protein